jgi:hypothetical protein
MFIVLTHLNLNLTSPKAHMIKDDLFPYTICPNLLLLFVPSFGFSCPRF